MWHCLQASQVEIEGINCMRKVAIAYMHDQFIDHKVLVGCGHWSRWHGRRRRCFGHRGWQSSMWHCLQASQVEIEGINCMRKVAIAYMHDQFIDHSPGGLRPLEPLAWAQAQMLRPQGLAKLHVALPAGITSRDRRYQLYEKGGYCIHI